MLPEEWEKKVVDMNTTELKDKQIQWADMVFISAMLVQKNSAQEVITRCKTLGKTVVAGGPAFTSQPELFTGVDHMVLNEAEITLPLFLNDLKEGKAKPVYTSDEKPDIVNTPVPLWSLIRLKDYVTIPVQYSRGCPFNCEFCDIIVMYGRKPRTKTPEQMIRELQSLYDAGWRETVFIVDDNFIGNKVHVKQMLPALIEWQKKHKFPFTLMTEASVNLADDEELMGMMREANFHKIFLGIETPNTDSLKECGKTQNTARNLAHGVKTIQRFGMQVLGGFIVGFDTDTESIFQRQIDFIQKNRDRHRHGGNAQRPAPYPPVAPAERRRPAPGRPHRRKHRRQPELSAPDGRKKPDRGLPENPRHHLFHQKLLPANPHLHPQFPAGKQKPNHPGRHRGPLQKHVAYRRLIQSPDSLLEPDHQNPAHPTSGLPPSPSNWPSPASISSGSPKKSSTWAFKIRLFAKPTKIIRAAWLRLMRSLLLSSAKAVGYALAHLSIFSFAKPVLSKPVIESDQSHHLPHVPTCFSSLRYNAFYSN